MLMRTDPFRELDRLINTVAGSRAHPAAMPMDAYRADDTVLVHLDLPGVPREAIDLTVEQNVLTVRAERAPSDEGAEQLVAERPSGVFIRELSLGDTVDTDRLTAEYDDGVLTIKIPIAAKPKGRKVEISDGTDRTALPA